MCEGERRGNVTPRAAHNHSRPPSNPRRAASFWLSPATPRLRPYQADITATCLLHNTLVCLPTGTGKTAVAAAVMLNFARWFPAGVTAFLAPTRPLVLQQAAAVAAAIGAAESEVEVATGGTRAAGRAGVWHAPPVRHVFTTPQAFHNDIRLGACPSDRVVCVIVDECHRAVGRADGAAALRRLAAGGVKARVVGLSATPGSSREAVQEVLTNLGAARIEFRAEDDPDVAPYVSARAERARVVPRPPGPAPARAAACAALRRSLAEAGPAYRGPSDPGCVPRATLLSAARDADAAGDATAACWLRAAALLAGTRDALDAYGLPAARDLLASDAATSAAAPLASVGDLAWLALTAAAVAASAPGDAKLAALRDELAPVVAAPASASTTRPRAIVFTTLRERVTSVVDALRADGIDARAFVGQGAAAAGGGGRGRGRGATAPPRGVGMKQAEQTAVLAAFRAGAFPVLVATAVGEEGLDVPSVDVVVGLEPSAPLRAAQRAGRTARGRPGSVVWLLEEGREEEVHRRTVEVSMCGDKRERWRVGGGEERCTDPFLPPLSLFPQSTTALHAALRAQAFDLARRAPRMLPREFVPVCVDAPSPPQAAAAVPPPPPRPRGRARAAGAPVAAPPPAAALPAALAGLLFPRDTAQAVSVGADGGLVIAPPPVGLVRDVAGSVDDEVDDGDTDDEQAHALPSPPRPPLAPRAAPQTGTSPVSERLSQMTVSGSAKQHTVRGASSVGDAGGASAPVAPPPAARLPVDPLFAPDTASAEEGGDLDWPVDDGVVGDDGWCLDDDGWPVDGSAAVATAPQRVSSPSTAPRAGAAGARRVLLDSASPPLPRGRATVARLVVDSASPTPHPRARLARKRDRDGGGAPARQPAPPPRPRGVAALVDDEASASDAGSEDDGNASASFESSFVSDDGAAPPSAAAAAHEGAFAAYRAAMLADGGTPAWPGARARARARAAALAVDTPGAASRDTDDAYDEDDSFLASEGDGEEGGTLSASTAPSQHDATCRACGRGGDTRPLLACARCPTVAHVSCVGVRRRVDVWLCAVCGDE